MSIQTVLAAALLTSTWIACANPPPQVIGDEVSVRLGETMRVALTRGQDGSARATVVSEASADTPAVTFRFSDQGTYRMLKVVNDYPYTLYFAVRMCISESKQCAETNVLPVGPHLSNFESWPDPIDVLYFSDFRLIGG